MEESAFIESEMIQSLVAVRARSLQTGWTPDSGRQRSALSTLHPQEKHYRTTKAAKITKAFFIAIFVPFVFFVVNLFEHAALW